MVDFWAERGLCVGSVYFKLRNVHKYSRMASGRDRMKLMNMQIWCW